MVIDGEFSLHAGSLFAVWRHQNQLAVDALGIQNRGVLCKLGSEAASVLTVGDPGRPEMTVVDEKFNSHIAGKHPQRLAASDRLEDVSKQTVVDLMQIDAVDKPAIFLEEVRKCLRVHNERTTVCSKGFDIRRYDK